MDETGASYTEWSKPERKTHIYVLVYCIYMEFSIYMEFRKMVMITLSFARQQKRHRCIEESFGFGGRRQVWDDLRE